MLTLEPKNTASEALFRLNIHEALSNKLEVRHYQRVMLYSQENMIR